MSSDGKHYAYIKAVAGGVAAVVEGREGLQYDEIQALQFAGHGSRVAYVAKKASLSYAVVDGVEMESQSTVSDFRFSDDGSRFAYLAFKDGRHSVVIDGKESQKYSEIAAGSLTFSPDSKHSAYAATVGYLKSELQVDGHAANRQTGEISSPFRRKLAFPPIMFSPDSNHVAYSASMMVGVARIGSFVDQTQVGPNAASAFPCFSPDSNASRKRFGPARAIRFREWESGPYVRRHSRSQR